MKDEEKIMIGVYFAVAAALVILYAKRKSIYSAVKTAVLDYKSEAAINTLHPKVRDKAREFLNKAQSKGFNLRITSAFRTYEEQDKLYAQGRTTSGGIVTYAKSGQSSHNFGTGLDVVPISNGKAVWDADWNKIGEIGKSVGFSWGGDWERKDRPHFEMNFGYTQAQLRNLKDSGKVSGGYVIV